MQFRGSAKMLVLKMLSIAIVKRLAEELVGLMSEIVPILLERVIPGLARIC